MRVTTPVKGFTGESCGVEFVGGVAEVPEDHPALDYFASAGYGIDGDPPAVDAEPTVDARAAVEVAVGNRLRDAAVEPEPQDFLPPVNAGQADPHGPEVIAPEIHASEGVRPIKPGPVPEDPAAQSEAETAHAVTVQAEGTEAVTAEPDVAAGSERPARSASKADWVAFAVAQGSDPDEAEAATKAELVERYGGEG